MIKSDVYDWDISGPLPRILPFALFMAFIGIGEGMELLARFGLIDLSNTALYYLYPAKAATVAGLLVFLGKYRELCWRDLKAGRQTAVVCLIGLATWSIWISLDAPYFLSGTPKGFNPTLLPAGPVRLSMSLIRIAGAVLVVPVMEELFWRSFLIRYLIDPDFEAVPIGRFTWPSFLITTLLFGLEHHQMVAGMAAGMIYNLILYKTRSIAQCVLAHAVTNLALAIYVLNTGSWYFW